MDRARFEHLLDAYGADFRRWPANERVPAEAFMRENAQVLAPLLDTAGALDAKLDLARSSPSPSAGLISRIVAAAPRARAAPRRTNYAPAGWALAACTLLGVLIGYSGGALAAPSADQDDYFAAAFEAPPTMIDTGDPG
ncbi:MAG: hypothetical protein HY054_04040 [Proteobacteria bacterium]|nr:hypothetical protein [Pseudomonadota bacterium]